MSLIQEFLDDHIGQLQSMLSEVDESDIGEDYSGYFHVDGEEGDHGQIKYLLCHQLVATKIIHGGDRYEWDWTEFGKAWMLNKIASFVLKL